MTEMQQRVAVSVVFIPVILAAMWFGGFALLFVFAIVSFLCTSEYIAMLRGIRIQIGWHWLPLSLFFFLALVIIPGWELMIFWLLFLAVVVEQLIHWDVNKSVPVAALTFFGVFYTALLPALIVRLGADHQQYRLLFWLVILIWIVDSVAYFIGSAWGKHRNIFKMSPNKSLEGFLAGVLAPFIIVIILYIAGLFADLPFLLLMAFAAGVTGQLGDLAESMLKRFCSVKDSSRLIPGHGGILDRSDSILLAGSFLYCALIILDKVR